jgi:hypothetical protein
VLLLLAWAGYKNWETVEQKQGLLEWTLESASSQPAEVTVCVPDEDTRERIRVIMMDSLDEALHDQVKFLFQVWMKDDRGQPDRARVGARAAIRAHQAARKAALEWMPPICSN